MAGENWKAITMFEALRCLKRHLARVVFRILRLIAAPTPELKHSLS